MDSPAPKRRPRVSGDDTLLVSTLRNLTPYMWPPGRPDLHRRVLLALGAMLLAKLVSGVVPFAYKGIIDSLVPGTAQPVMLGLTIAGALVIAWVLGTVIATCLEQLRDTLFAQVGLHAVRKLALETFEHLHALSLRYHLS